MMELSTTTGSRGFQCLTTTIATFLSSSGTTVCTPYSADLKSRCESVHSFHHVDRMPNQGIQRVTWRELKSHSRSAQGIHQGADDRSSSSSKHREMKRLTGDYHLHAFSPTMTRQRRQRVYRRWYCFLEWSLRTTMEKSIFFARKLGGAKIG